MSKPTMHVTGFWLRNNLDGYIEFLVEHNGKWVVVFGPDSGGPVARDRDQLISHMIHAGGMQNLIDHGSIHAQPRICASCGHPEDNHKYRHPFVPWAPGMRDPRSR